MLAGESSGTYQRCVGDIVTKKTRFLRGSTLEETQSAQDPMANSMPARPSNSSQMPLSPPLHLHGFIAWLRYPCVMFGNSKKKKASIFYLIINCGCCCDHCTYDSFTGPCLHHRYVLKINMSACSHCDECLRTESGRIIRSSNLWFTGSSEFDSTRSGAQRNSIVALYSCRWHE